MVKLDVNADYVSMPELAQELLKRVESGKREIVYNEGNPNWQNYMRGIVSAYKSVLDAIGYDEPEM
jgi:hypothetical protein